MTWPRGLLNFFLEEIGPAVYNQGVADAQKRLQESTESWDAAPPALPL